MAKEDDALKTVLETIKFLENFPVFDAGRERAGDLKLQQAGKARIKKFFEKKQGRDTAGVVAINSKGEIVAGTSTGGTPFKLSGRVGDSPIVRAGFYADDVFGGASATGWGEGFFKWGSPGWLWTF